MPRPRRRQEGEDALGGLNDLRVQLRIARDFDDPLPDLCGWLKARRDQERVRAAALVGEFLGRREAPGYGPRAPAAITATPSSRR